MTSKRTKKPYFLWFSGGSTDKSQSFQASVQCWAIIGTPAKRPGGPMMARFLWYLDPLINKKKKKFTKLDPYEKAFWIRACDKSWWFHIYLEGHG